MIEGALFGGRFEDHISAAPPVTPVRAALGNIFFSPEAYAPGATVSRLDGNTCFINEFHAA
jgi:hypothetical protein